MCQGRSHKLLTAAFSHARWLQARFMLAKLNPSATHDTAGSVAGSAGEVILTDDVSLAVFQQHLARLAVQSSSYSKHHAGCNA